jgi:uncharacterized protein with FMN-binding domain
MKIASICIFVIFATLSASVLAQDVKMSDKTKDSVVVYKDGNYEGSSRATYIYEPFWGKVHLTIKNGVVDFITFAIRDSNLHETFDGNYEKHFTGNDVYVQQSRNDWKGVQNYPTKLTGQHNISQVDAVSGATWSYNIFKASVNEALKNAK